MSDKTDEELAAAREIVELETRSFELYSEEKFDEDSIAAILAAHRAPDAAELAKAINLILDQVDYLAGNCRVNEMIGAILPKEIISIARAALARYEAQSK